MTQSAGYSHTFSGTYDGLPTPESKLAYKAMMERHKRETKSESQRIALALTLEHIRAMEIFEYGTPR
jgi:hypothetical protein